MEKAVVEPGSFVASRILCRILCVFLQLTFLGRPCQMPIGQEYRLSRRYDTKRNIHESMCSNSQKKPHPCLLYFICLLTEVTSRMELPLRIYIFKFAHFTKTNICVNYASLSLSLTHQRSPFLNLFFHRSRCLSFTTSTPSRLNLSPFTT